MKDINVEEFKELVKEKGNNLEVIDVRDQNEFEIIHLKNSKLIPTMGVQNRINEIDWNKTVVLVCRSGARSSYVGRSLNGDYNTLNLLGGLGACYQEEECRNLLVVDEEKIKNYF
jgi:rhodanese-related sulfurtransferase